MGENKDITHHLKQTKTEIRFLEISSDLFYVIGVPKGDFVRFKPSQIQLDDAPPKTKTKTKARTRTNTKSQHFSYIAHAV